MTERSDAATLREALAQRHPGALLTLSASGVARWLGWDAARAQEALEAVGCERRVEVRCRRWLCDGIADVTEQAKAGVARFAFRCERCDRDVEVPRTRGLIRWRVRVAGA